MTEPVEQPTPSAAADCSFTVTTKCCDTWPKILGAFDWWSVSDNDEFLVMPCIQTVDDSGVQSSWRVNHCPSCGTNLRDTIISREMLETARADLPLMRR